MRRANDSIHNVFMKPEHHKQLKEYAEDNNLSVSAALSELIETYVTEGVVPERKKRSKRVTFWMSPKLWARAKALARKSSMTVTEMVEHAMEGKV